MHNALSSLLQPKHKERCRPEQQGRGRGARGLLDVRRRQPHIVGVDMAYRLRTSRSPEPSDWHKLQPRQLVPAALCGSQAQPSRQSTSPTSSPSVDNDWWTKSSDSTSYTIRIRHTQPPANMVATILRQLRPATAWRSIALRATTTVPSRIPSIVNRTIRPTQRPFSATPIQNKTLNQVLRVRTSTQSHC